MKKLLFGLALATAAMNTNAQTVLSGTLTTQTLSGCYLLQGCVKIPSGVVVTVLPGTVFLGDYTTGQEGALVVERGGQIFADGFPGNIGTPNPIIFTSARPAGQRQPGDWGGIIIAGNAPNNQGTFTVEGPCTPITAGGTNANDNSGVLRYVQVHYAGRNFGTVPGNEINSVTLAAVGNGTTIDHIQVTNANDDAFEWFGGNVNSKYLIAYDTRDDDFDTDFGFNGKVQFGFALRKNPNMHDVSGSNGIESDNNNNASGSYAGTPQTRPVFSNFSLFGPLTCNAAPVSNEFKNGALIRRNSAHSVYNSVITGWPEYGLRIDNTQTVANTASDLLEFSYNTFSNNGLGNEGNPSTSWSSGCNASMTDWLFSPFASGCDEVGNQQETSITGFGSICNDDCTESRPSFTYTPGNLEDPNYDHADLDGFFDDVSFRGAFGTTDWTIGWTEWCPQEAPYCTSELGKAASQEATGLQLVPNPSSSITYAIFNAKTTGKATISILDKVTGQPVRVITADITEAGQQRIAVNASGLQMGVYAVRVELADNVMTQQLVVE